MAIHPPLPYKIAGGSESVGQNGTAGIKIEIYHSAFEYDSRNKAHAKLDEAIYTATKMIEEEMTALAVATDPRNAARTAAERESLIGAFPAGAVIYVEPIPNGYCSRACCRHLPWYKVTGPFGVITLGWRKRVISIDWSESSFKVNTANLFTFEDVTKGEHLIHAWSTEKAKEYLATLFRAFDPSRFLPYVPPTPEPADNLAEEDHAASVASS